MRITVKAKPNSDENKVEKYENYIRKICEGHHGKR